MKPFLLLLLMGSLVYAQTSKTPIKNGILQSDLNAAGYKILSANLSDYAGTNMTWNVGTGKFDVTGGGGGGAPTTTTYITQIPDAGLSAEVALSTLATGLLKSTTTTGALTTITDNSTNWNTAFTQMLQWDGGATNLVAATGRTSLGLGTAAQANSTAFEVPLTFSTGLTRSTNTVTVNTSQNIATLSNLTTNGFVKTGGAVGTLSVDTSTYQTSSANLTTWAGVAPTTVGTSFVTLANPSAITFPEISATNVVSTKTAAQLKTDLSLTATDVGLGSVTNNAQTQAAIVPNTAPATGKILIGNGTSYVLSTPTWPTASGSSGVMLQSNGTNFITSTATWPTAATTGKIVMGNGTNYVESTPTYPNAATPTALKWLRADGTNWIASTSTLAEGAVTAGKILKSDGTNWTASTETYAAPGTSGNQLTSDGTNWTSATPPSTHYIGGSAAGLTACCASNAIIPGSTVTIPTGAWKAGGSYHCVFDMTKTGAGLANFIINIHMGTAGTTSDVVIVTITATAAQTAVVDAGLFDVYATFKSVGSGTSAVLSAEYRLNRISASGGLLSTVNQISIVGGTSAGFNSTTQTKMSVGFNGGASFSGTNSFCQTDYEQ